MLRLKVTNCGSTPMLTLLLVLAVPRFLAAQQQPPQPPSAWDVSVRASQSVAQPEALAGAADRRYFIGSSLFMMANLLPDDEPPAFVQLNLGYLITPRDVISLDAITCQYHSPLGVPWGAL